MLNTITTIWKQKSIDVTKSYNKILTIFNSGNKNYNHY